MLLRVAEQSWDSDKKGIGWTKADEILHEQD
jgi:hypothetical protein